MLTDDLTLAQRGEQLAQQCRAAKINFAFEEDPAYPELLRDIRDPPAVLFHIGPGAHAPPRRRLAMVGSRNPDAEFLLTARKFANEIAASGVGIVSGGAMGIDELCHRGAIANRGETWAFLGSALDQLDTHQAQLWHDMREVGATIFSELPPGVRAKTDTFPRRNRLISGSANATLVLRAAEKSGTVHTINAALSQKRPLLAIPGELRCLKAFMCNKIISLGQAALCFDSSQAISATGATNKPSDRPAEPTAPVVSLDAMSPNARTAYAVMLRQPVDFETVLSASGLPSSSLIAALTELSLFGLVVQHPGRRFERL